MTDIPYPEADLPPETEVYCSDARDTPLQDGSVDLIVTSPPYYQQRDYGVDGQIGQEATVDEYVSTLLDALSEWRRILTDHGSVFLNIGDVYENKSLQSIPSRLASLARERGWTLRNDIVWVKDGGMPDAADDRLASTHEHILHLTDGDNYYYDLYGYSNTYGNGSNPGDVWTFGFDRNTDGHLAPFPEELVERAVTAAAPRAACTECGSPRERTLRRTDQLDEDRYQARRAMEIYEESDLTFDHIRAVQSKGITDTGKARETQTGTGRNSDEVERLAAEARNVLGSYYREFTYAKKETAGFTECDCTAPTRPGVVCDPFVGTGTTLDVAERMGLGGIGIDIQTDYARQTTTGSSEFTNAK